MRNSILALLVLAPASLSAQTAVISIPTQQCVWRAGDDMRWAAPAIDETGWQPFTQWKLNPSEPRIWVRCHADLSPLRGLARPAIQVNFYAAYQLFVNGEPVGAAGNLRSGSFSMNTIRSYALPKPLPQNAAIALRITYRFTGTAPESPPPPLQLDAGDESALRDRRAGVVLAQSLDNLTASICFGMICVFGSILLGLYLTDRGRSELLLLSIVCFSMAAIYLNNACSFALVDYSQAAYLAIFSIGTVVIEMAEPWFFFRLARRRVPLVFWVLIGLAVQDHALVGVEAFLPAAQALHLAAFCARWAAPAGFAARTALAFTPFIAFWPYARIPVHMRPLAILCMVWGATEVLLFSVRLTTFHIAGVPNFAPRWDNALEEALAISTLCVIAALLGLLFREQRRVADERAEMAGEMQAARRVQQYLIPAQLPHTPGFAIESEYRPAREVGGDFFQVLPRPADGSLLIVVGDVAGKGVEAGMLAALIVGAIRTAVEFTSEPEHILSLLNKRLQGRGLVTCLALRIETDGAVTLANAGHLPPYLNGQEMAIEGSLPLGAAAGIEFPVSRFQLAESDSLILMTDGVAEAQDAQGRLFGFERIRELLRDGTGGAALAAAAQNFGQQDDITVLTIQFAPVAVLHA
jgi:hypothetical protein